MQGRESRGSECVHGAGAAGRGARRCRRNDPLPRTEITKKLWDYIRSNGLQDQKDRRQINADDKLRKVFNGKDSVSMFEMTKLVSGHIKK